MASSAKFRVDHAALEYLLDLPEGVWILGIERVPTLNGNGWAFDFLVKSEDEEQFPQARLDAVYETSEHGAVALKGWMVRAEDPSVVTG